MSCSDSNAPSGPSSSDPEAPELRPASIIITAGNDQFGAMGAALSGLLEVRVTDASGRPVPGVSVLFAVTHGGGSVSPAATVTDANGDASSTWVLGAASGTQLASARVQDLDPVEFTAVLDASLDAWILRRPNIARAIGWWDIGGDIRSFIVSANADAVVAAIAMLLIVLALRGLLAALERIPLPAAGGDE